MEKANEKILKKRLKSQIQEFPYRLHYLTMGKECNTNVLSVRLLHLKNSK